MYSAYQDTAKHECVSSILETIQWGKHARLEKSREKKSVFWEGEELICPYCNGSGKLLAPGWGCPTLEAVCYTCDGQGHGDKEVLAEKKLLYDCEFNRCIAKWVVGIMIFCCLFALIMLAAILSQR